MHGKQSVVFSAFKDKSTSDIILNYQQNIVHVKLSIEHFSYCAISVGAIFITLFYIFIIYIYNI